MNMSGVVVLMLLNTLRWILYMHTHPFLRRDKDQNLDRLNSDHTISTKLVRMSSDTMNKAILKKIPSKTLKIS